MRGIERTGLGSEASSPLATRRSHSLRLLTSCLEPRISKAYSLGASLAPPRSSTLNLIGPQQRESPPIVLDVTEAAAFSTGTSPAVTEEGPPSAPACQTPGKGCRPQLPPQPGPQDPRSPPDAQDPAVDVGGREKRPFLALGTDLPEAPLPPRLSPERRSQPHGIMGNVVQEL